MPNWCHNILTTIGPSSAVSKFIEFIGADEPDFDFNKIIPYPEKFRRLDEAVEILEAEYEKRMKRKKVKRRIPKDGYNSGGYEWCIENWDVKWNVGKKCDWLTLSNFEAELAFKTPWNPPYKIIKKLSEMFPELEFSLAYSSFESSFEGVFTIKNNSVITNVCYDEIEE